MHVTAVGNLTRDFELRFTPSNQAVASSAMAVSKYKFNQQEQKWDTVNTTFYNLTVWGQMAEHAATHLAKGQRVIVTGDMVMREYETKEGGVGRSLDITVEDIGASLKWLKTGATGAPQAQQQTPQMQAFNQMPQQPGQPAPQQQGANFDAWQQPAPIPADPSNPPF